MADKTVKIDKTVVRNDHYRRGGLNKRERHNERKNMDYENDDIIKERAAFNVHFKRCMEDGDDKESGYAKMFDKMLADGAISTRGLTQDPYIVDELVFDVNSAYFENHGGYEYAKSFFEEAYRLAVKEIGGEQFVLSAVMHADERNSALSEQLGRDVFHYHLHVVYIPVVQKEVYFRKDNKNPELAGKLREVITQVSHSKKWPKEKKLDENGEVVLSKKGKAVLVNSYSLLQDHFFDHMREAGFIGFERGERGSTAEHLTVLQYKSQQEMERANREAERANQEAERAKQEAERAAALAAEVQQRQQAAAALDMEIKGKEKTAAALDNKVEQRIGHVKDLDKKIDDRNYAVTNIKSINKIGNTKSVLGKINVTQDELDYLKDFAREGANSRVIIKDLTEKVKRVEGERDTWKSKYEKLLERAGLFIEAVKHAPKKVVDFLKSVLREPPEIQEPQRTAPERTAPARKRSTGLDR